MTAGEGGVWYKCDECGHIVMPKNRLFECPCPKCYELNPDSLRESASPNPKAHQRKLRTLPTLPISLGFVVVDADLEKREIVQKGHTGVSEPELTVILGGVLN